MVDATLSTTVVAASAAVLALALAATVRWASRLSTKRAYTVPDAPGGLPLVNHTILLLANAHRYHDLMADLSARFKGRPFCTRVLGEAVNTVVNTPELFEDVLKTQFEAFDKGEYMCGVVRDVLGSGIFAVDGEKWRRQRKTASHLFTMRSLRDSMAHTVRDLLPLLHRLLERSMRENVPIDIAKLLNCFTMEAFCKIGFGADLNCLEQGLEHPFMAAFDGAQRILCQRFLVPRFIWQTMKWLNVGSERDLKNQIRVINKMVLDIISQTLEHHKRFGNGTAASRGSSSAGKDIVSLFIQDMDSDECRDNEPFDPTFLRDIVVNFVLAGRDTTAQALSWFLLELSENTEVENRVRNELKLVLPELFVPDASPPTMNDVLKLNYMEAAIKETLRLHPSVPGNAKMANRDTVLVDGTFIPKGSTVEISSYSLGRAEHVWGPDAKKFRPERWIDPANPNKLVTVSAFQFNSFHAGPRMCLGMNLAMMEMKIFIASVLSKFHLEAIPGQDTTYDLSLTLPIKGQLMMRVERAP